MFYSYLVKLDVVVSTVVVVVAELIDEKLAVLVVAVAVELFAAVVAVAEFAVEELPVAKVNIK